MQNLYCIKSRVSLIDKYRNRFKNSHCGIPEAFGILLIFLLFVAPVSGKIVQINGGTYYKEFGSDPQSCHQWVKDLTDRPLLPPANNVRVNFYAADNPYITLSNARNIGYTYTDDNGWFYFKTDTDLIKERYILTNIEKPDGYKITCQKIDHILKIFPNDPGKLVHAESLPNDVIYIDLIRDQPHLYRFFRFFGINSPAQDISAESGLERVRAPAEVRVRAPAAPDGTGNRNSQTIENAIISFQQSLLYIQNTTSEPDTEVIIPVMVSNINNLQGMDLVVEYNIEEKHTRVLTFIKAEKGSLNSEALFDSNLDEKLGSPSNPCPNIPEGPQDEGLWIQSVASKCGPPDSYHKIKISFASPKPISGSGSIAVLTFKVTCTKNKGYAGSKYTGTSLVPTLSSATDSAGKPMSFKTNNGYFDAFGKVNLGRLTSGTNPTTQDVLMALQMAVGKLQYDSSYDLNNDGKVDATDAVAILKIAVEGT